MAVVICRIGKVVVASVGGKFKEVSSVGVLSENPSGICGCGAATRTLVQRLLSNPILFESTLSTAIQFQSRKIS